MFTFCFNSLMSVYLSLEYLYCKFGEQRYLYELPEGMENKHTKGVLGRP